MTCWLLVRVKWNPQIQLCNIAPLIRIPNVPSLRVEGIQTSTRSRNWNLMSWRVAEMGTKSTQTGDNSPPQSDRPEPVSTPGLPWAKISSRTSTAVFTGQIQCTPFPCPCPLLAPLCMQFQTPVFIDVIFDLFSAGNQMHEPQGTTDGVARREQNVVIRMCVWTRRDVEGRVAHPNLPAV